MKKLVLLVILLLAFPILVHAQEPEPGTAADNACYTGGVMEGKCDTDWEWTCGYYLARWISAGEWFGNYPMPTSCASLLPPPPMGSAVTLTLTSVCLTSGFGPFLFTGTPNSSPNGGFYSTAGCTGILIVEGTLVEAPDISAANLICTNILSARGISHMGAVLAGIPSEPDQWFCSYVL